MKRLWRRVADNHALLMEAADLKLILDEMETPERDLYRKTHETIQQITRGLDGAFTFNTAVAGLMELMNAVDHLKISANSSPTAKAVYREAIETVVLLISPFAPHIAEELWLELGHSEGVMQARWPKSNEQALERDVIEIVIQVNGKTRDKFTCQQGLQLSRLRPMCWHWIVCRNGSKARRFARSLWFRSVGECSGKLTW